MSQGRCTIGKKPKSKSTSYSGSSNPAFQPLALSGANAVQGVFNQNQAGLQNLTNVAQNQLVPALTNKFQSGLAGSGEASNYYRGVVGGNMMNGNPYISSILSRIRGDVTNDVNAQFAQGGRYGSGAHTGVLTDRLADAESNLLYNNYTTEAARRDAAAAALAGQSGVDATQALAALGVGAELPYVGSNSLANSLGALFSGGQDKSKSTGTSPIWGAIGAGLSAAGTAASGGAFGSDRRLKKDIVEVGKLPNGLTVYDFTYKGDPEQATYRGVMADEVKDRVPEAYIENYNGTGMAGVNYALVGMPLLKLAA